ncbi:MAG TPA: hypothetical protein PKD64_01875 [Pirellulaceae bacterium]|nr:hypothetical protein [Pirellulaceae bacterium]HMO90919.1 hypothetical protein [Pirellulaceae bacterium]HMP68605.1 hypothetical protein [Pirellulaceae bacterium]
MRSSNGLHATAIPQARAGRLGGRKHVIQVENSLFKNVNGTSPMTVLGQGTGLYL